MNFVAGAMVRDGVVRLGRVELGCEADGFAPGTAVTLAIRPEDIVVQDVRAGKSHLVRGRAWCHRAGLGWPLGPDGRRARDRRP